MKRVLKKKTKTGASLLVVIIAVTMLIVMGTSFSVIAMSAYNNSHRRLCQQQAYYTAEACLNILSTQFASDPSGEYMNKIREMITKEFNDHPGKYAEVSDVEVTIANLADPDGNDGVTKIPSNNFEASLLGIVGGCIVTARAVPGTKTTDSISQIRLISTGIYKGYSETVSARMATTTNGALELKKVFSNSQSWKTPIVTLIAGETTGDMYFSSPGKYLRWPNGEIRLDSAYVPGVKPQTTYKKYNENIRDTIYNNVASGNVNNTGTNVHTRPFGIDNKPLKTPSMRCIPMKDIIMSEEKIKHYDCYENKNAPAEKKKAYDALWNEYKTLASSYFVVGEPIEGTEYSNYYPKSGSYNEMIGPNGEHMMLNTHRYFYWAGHKEPDMDYYGVESELITLGKPTTFTNQYSETDRWYNDWVEIYMFTGNHGPNAKSIVDGDMYVNTQALIGLYDKDQTQVKYWPYRDVVSNRDKVERKYVSYAGSNFEDDFDFYRDIYRNGYDMGNNFEHGGQNNTDLFFDYNAKPPKFNQSILSHNGNMYLFEDARIECYDSTHTTNASKGVKNNIFAHKNLVIDGVAMQQGMTEVKTAGKSRDYSHAGRKNINYKINNLYTERNVSIFGDVMVEGDLMISNATIYGDVYVNGDNLYISDSEIYGNVYFNGTHMVTDGADIRGDDKTKLFKGTKPDGEPDFYQENEKEIINAQTNKKLAAGEGFSFQTDEGKVIKLNGGDLVVLGRRNGEQIPDTDPLAYSDTDELKDERAFTEQENRYITERKDRHMWGVRLTNTSVYGTLFSEINTAINTMFRSVDDYRDANGVLHTVSSTDMASENIIDGDYIEDVYGNIVVSANLLFDLQEKYRHDQRWGDQTYLATLINNAVRVKGVCMAERMQIVQTQSGDGIFKPNFTRYEQKYIKDPDNELTTSTKIAHGCIAAEDKDKDKATYPSTFDEQKKVYPYLPHFVVNRRTKESSSTHYRCSNVHINTLNVGNGGLYIDGTQQYYEHGKNLSKIAGYRGDYWYAQKQSNAKEHSGIIINKVYCTSNLTGNYKLNGKNKTTASKIAVYNLAGQPSKTDDSTYTNCEVYTPLAVSTYFRGESGPTHFNQKTVENIRITMYGEIYDLIESELGGRIEYDNKNKGKAVTRPSKNTDLGSMDAIMDVLREYYMKEKAPHRINSYYRFMSDSMNYRGYKDLTDIRVWADNKEGLGPYQRFDPDATDGVWRQIKVLKWSAPDKITPHTLTKEEISAAIDKPQVGNSSTGGIRNKDAINVTKLNAIEEYITKDEDGTTVITGSIKTDRALYVPNNSKLIFDTSRNNLHCQLEGGLILGDNAQVILRGGNMTFLYMTNNDYEVKSPTSVNNLILFMGENSRIGIVEGSQTNDKVDDSIYIIANDPVSLIHMQHASTIYGYVYAPDGHLQIDEFTWGSTTKDGVTTSARTYYDGTVNTVVRGSMIVKSFLIDMTIGYNQIYNMYKNLKYEYIMAPLICDVNISFGDNKDQIKDYGTINWGFIGFD